MGAKSKIIRTLLVVGDHLQCDSVIRAFSYYKPLQWFMIALHLKYSVLETFYLHCLYDNVYIKLLCV